MWLSSVYPGRERSHEGLKNAGFSASKSQVQEAEECKALEVMTPEDLKRVTIKGVDNAWFLNDNSIQCSKQNKVPTL